jgi:hypothetical protein
MLLFAYNQTLHEREFYENWAFWAMTIFAVWMLLIVFGPRVHRHDPNDPQTKHIPPGSSRG